ncbi:MAG TPA: DNA polymerase III subunit delta [Candidatus Saccharimonadales bacterium]
MVITITGDNSYLMRSAINDLLDEHSASNGVLGTEIIYSADQNYEQLKQTLSSSSLFSQSRLVVLNEPSKTKEFSDKIEEIISSMLDSTTLVILEPSLDKRLSYYKFLVKSTDFRQFNKLSPQSLVDFIVGYAKNLGATINRSSAVHLIDRVGDDQMGLASEVDKLSLYSSEITAQTIDLLCEQSPTSTIFQLLDAAFSNQPKRALELYNDQRAQKVEPDQILAMLSWQLQTLAQVISGNNMTADQIARGTKISPYAVQKAKSVATKISFSKLKQLVYDLSRLDWRSKRNSLDLDEAIKNYIISI